MNGDKSKNIIISLLLVIIAILVALVVLFATDTLNFNLNNDNLDNTNENVIENVDNNNQEQQDNKVEENNSIFGGEYVYNLSTGAKVYTDYTNDGSFYYKRVEPDNTVSTYGYGIYTLNGDVLIEKIVFGIDINKKSIVKSVVSESIYKVNDGSIEYDASGTSGQNHVEEKISDDCNISKEVTAYLYGISKSNEHNTNFIYE